LTHSTINLNYGSILFLGSGETSSTGRILHEQVFQKYTKKKINVAVLETPAGFEPNSDAVAKDIADFFTQKLKNFHPDVEIIPARRRDGDFSTNSEQIICGIKSADHIYLGAGSPTYLVKHLYESLALDAIHDQHELGSSVCLTSASSIAFGRWTLPVYEIFKVGMDLYWEQGLNFFSRFNLDISVIPHWNNNDGGNKIDTSRCYLGKQRVEELLTLLPSESLVLGLDEHTGLHLEFSTQTVSVLGKGSVHLIKSGQETIFTNGAKFPFSQLGDFKLPSIESTGKLNSQLLHIPDDIVTIAELRLNARKKRNWIEADNLRKKICSMGYTIEDNNNGYNISKV
jgi:cyanophycinase-like exopeptidase